MNTLQLVASVPSRIVSPSTFPVRLTISPWKIINYEFKCFMNFVAHTPTVLTNQYCVHIFFITILSAKYYRLVTIVQQIILIDRNQGEGAGHS